MGGDAIEFQRVGLGAGSGKCRGVFQCFTGHVFFAMLLLALDLKPHFWANHFARVFEKFFSQDAMGVYPVAVSLWAKPSPFRPRFMAIASREMNWPR